MTLSIIGLFSTLSTNDTLSMDDTQHNVFSVIMLSVVKLSVIIMSAVMLNAVMLNVVMLSAVAP